MSTHPPSVNNIFQGYSPPGGVFDEFMMDATQERPHSKLFLDAVIKIGRDEFEHRWQQAQRTVQANDFAYSGYVTPEDKPRPWELDAIPFLISAEEWNHVSTALEQRAQLLNLILKDLYGKQSLLKENILPPELVFSHPGFLRAYQREELPNDRFSAFLCG